MAMLPGPLAVVPPTEQFREVGADNKELRRLSADGAHPGVRQRLWGFDARLDPTVTFEEFTYWAKVEREMEEVEYKRYQKTLTGTGFAGTLKGYFTSNPYEDAKAKERATPQELQNVPHRDPDAIGEHKDSMDEDIKAIAPGETHDYDAEWRTAARALRTAGWGGIFYLITTDILGWGQTPYVFSNTGYGLGVGIFLLMGIAAACSGFFIWRTYLALDSSRYPMLSFGDPYFRLFGPKTRHFINIIQALQLFLTVCVVLLGQTYIIAQLGANVDICFIACGVIVLVVSMASGYMRALKHLGWFCNAAVWLNVITFIIICVGAAKFGPDITPSVQLGILPKKWLTNPAPVKTFVGTPVNPYQPTDANYFAAKFNGINSIVYAYSGAILFVAFLAEMRHPMDFWKAVWLAQLFITVIYIFFGVFAYHYYGQYSYVLINQVVQPFGLQVVGNTLSLITGWLAIFLYFNVGMKTVYLEVGQEVFGLPAITTKKGKLLWWALGPVYWILAFIVAMSIPQFTAFTNFVGGLFSLNFTYSLAALMYFACRVQEGARLEGEGFDPNTGVTTRHDSGMKRLMRGFWTNWKTTIPSLIFTLAGFAASGMGTWAAILALESAFAPAGSVVTSWTCLNPFA